ncbi:MAG TPA: glycosyltransferase family 4 protein [Nitrososphaerales archaeon]|nr:glycosyltransferase family 4 protein [Nitrososphaerales archaeon]
MRLCINSQSPPVRFKLGLEDLLEKYGTLPDPVELTDLENGVDYEFTPGGVTAMVYPLVRRLMEGGQVEKANWVSLGVRYPPRVRVGGILVSHVEMPEEVLRDYTAFKEGLWSQFHGMGGELSFDGGYVAYSKFNWVNSQKLLELRQDSDAFFVHDFQLLQTGAIVGPPAPAVLRWHIPFVPDVLPHLTRRAVVKWIEEFDAIIVSTRRDLEGLVKSGYRGRAHLEYPFIDPALWKLNPGPEEVARFDEMIGRRKNEKLLLMVARMDRIKSQDVAIRALSRLRHMGNFRLALVGNGSFSSSKTGGLGHSKAARWRAELEALARELGVQDRVRFVGFAPEPILRAAYRAADIVLLTSNLEGFGISALEGWINRKPIVVSKGTGVSELVVDGSNGYTFRAGDDSAAAEAVLSAENHAERLGVNGFETAKQCYIERALEREKEVIEEAQSIYK